MLCGIQNRTLVNTFRLVWFRPGRSFIIANLCITLSMLAGPSLLKATNTQFIWLISYKNLKIQLILVNWILLSSILGQNNSAIRYANTPRTHFSPIQFDKRCLKRTWLFFWKLMKIYLEMWHLNDWVDK